MKEAERSGNDMFIILADILFILCGREKIEPVEEITKGWTFAPWEQQSPARLSNGKYLLSL